MKEKIVENLKQMGKDRFLLLFFAGLLCVFLSYSFSGTKKEETGKNEKKESKAQLLKTEEAALSFADAGHTDEKTKEQAGLANYKSLQNAANENILLFYEDYYEQKLTNFLSQMYGAGKVQVLVTMEDSPEYIVAKNSPYTRKNEEERKGGDTKTVTEIQNESEYVFYETEGGQKEPIILKQLAPRIKGVVVLAQGAEKTSVSREITLLLEALFGIDSHKIKVAKLSSKN